jgi:hypothetical protein
MDTNFLYTINAQAAWNYEQQMLKRSQPQKQQRYYIQAKIDERRPELEAAIAVGETLKKHQQQQNSLEIQKQLFRNEKDQETARCRLYLAEDRLKRFDEQKQQYKSPAQRRRSATTKERREAKNYIDELFEKAQLNIAIGNVQTLPQERRRYSIPHTIRE